MERIRLLHQRFKVILAQDGVGQLFLHIVAINIIFSGILLVIGWFIDFAAVYRQFSVMTMAQYQSLNIFGALLAEVFITLLTIFQWLYRRHFSNASTGRMIAEGEHERLELKSSLRWDFKMKAVNKDLEHAVIKSIAGFMNTRGGTLIIGADDKGELVGLDADCQTLHKKDYDGFLLHLAQLVNDSIGKEYGHYVAARVFKIVPDLTNKVNRVSAKNESEPVAICRIDVLPARKPAYINNAKKQQFFVRVGAATQELQVKEAHEYINMRWS